MLYFIQNRSFFSVFACLICVFSLAKAQKATTPPGQKSASPEMPEVVCYPNPAKLGTPLTIKFADPEAAGFETLTLTVRIIDEHGRVFFTEELPDELEFTPASDHFTKGNYYLQYYQNGRLFQTEELRFE